MDSHTYHKIYNLLHDFEDVFSLSEEYTKPAGVLATILNQKVVKMTRFRHRKIYSREEEIFAKWKQGLSILELAKRFHFPPTLMASLIMKKCGYSRKATNCLFKSPADIEKRRLRKEVKKALEADYFFSPRAHSLQGKKGEMGEAIIRKWLDNKELSYFTENELREQGDGKTPDFVLKTPLCIEGLEVKWIESKALFGDEFEHKHYSRKQFKEYSEIFGEGMVVYWYGCLEGLPADSYLVKDYSFFEECGEEVKNLLNYLVYW